MKKIKILLFFFFFTISAFSQQYELGKITVDELAEKVHQKDTSAPAAILFKLGKTYFDRDFNLVTEVKVRIKIYKKEGYEYAQKEMGYFSKSRDFRVKFENAVTYNLVNGTIETTKLKSSGQFDGELSENISFKKIILPNVKEGSVIEYSYTSRMPFNLTIPEWHFQYKIPVNYIQYTVCVPQYQTYRQFLKGTVKINQSEAQVVRSSYDSYKESHISYSAENVIALKEVPFMTNMENYRSSIQFELATTGITKKTFKKYAADWESVAKLLYTKSSFGGQLLHRFYFEKDLDPLLKEVNLQDEKIKIIYDFVKARMTWDENDGYFSASGVKEAYKQKNGNSGDINLMLVAMLRHYGLNANPILISTASNGIARHPNLTAYDYVIAGVEKEGDKIVLLDATEKKAPPGILPLRALNWLGRLLRENYSSKEVDLMPKEKTKQIVNVIASIDQYGKIKGKNRIQNFDYHAYLFRDNYIETQRETYIQNLEKEYNGIEIENYVVQNKTDLLKPLIEEYDFTDNNGTVKINDKIYFSPMLHYVTTINPFVEEEREYSVDFPFSYQDKYTFTIEIPEGYLIEYMPKSIFLAMEQNIGTFKFTISDLGKHIQLVVTTEINDTSIAKEYYPDLKDFYRKMIEKQNEKIILVKNK